ncbi:sterol desaturase/sphingolipid hydroxylase (fatty acid hydroxylase superfamily) [Stackebrandtia albiflava]|uniref:Sterol desaturase/sphingolipid hydroxylase (Fatty acid hydroxylase superfamily) n=1 Tax=Stackebrandtia albiflava TaxID=406432 RepID=A0A562V555_9ACTN|nr:sterol desaturase family protein [Stackebrandtia albiflava]TWJ13031.1 sterol desaturase/sphingolipid hydroxylase (fatty acid hydroxylase superfamily) [Stackebrandtia albiflava]
MIQAVVYAIPAFVLFVVIEALSFHFAPDEEERGYDLRDSATSLTMGAGSQVVGFFWKFATILVYAAAFEYLAPWNLDIVGNPVIAGSAVAVTVTLFGLFVADDLAYYWFHRSHHRVRLLWASHVVHHSSRYYNFTTALRQSWTPMSGLPFWLPLALIGFPPWMIFLQQSISLIYQFFLHTERIGTLWRPVEFVMNTPSHHRVHHGSNEMYLDRNYGGILIVWDRLFRTFQPEDVRVVYGLTRDIDTHNPIKVAFHEYADIWRDVRAHRGLRTRLGYLFGPPGWTADHR